VVADYIGEAGKPVEVRCGDHRRFLEKAGQFKQHGDPLGGVSSHLAVHAASNNQVVDWSEVDVVSKESHWYKKKIHEATIMIVPDKMISEPSVNIPRMWHSLRKEQKG
jgi:hypothetical protein